jgi:NAD(P)-dependent dehydrogenase (short-subunit alcohol dehydrogenase family)
MGNYSDSKFVLDGFSEVLRQEVGSLGTWVAIGGRV